MPATTVAHALPYVNWIVLVTLAVGAFAFVCVTALTTDATRGYLGFTAFCAAILGGLALASDSALPAPDTLVLRAAPPELDAARTFGLAAFALVALGFTVAVRRSRGARLAASAVGIGAGLIALVAAAAGWAPTVADAVPFGVQLLTLSAVTGGSLAAIVLGHWYLVTPKLSGRPLVGQARWLLAALIVQALLFVVWATLGGGVDQQAWEALTGPAALLTILRGAITVTFPLALVFMALKTAHTRSMESATGLLYINLAAVLAGTIGAAALYVSGGILV